MIIDWSKAPDWAQELATNPYNEKAWLGDEGYSYLVGNGGVVPWSHETAFARTAFKNIEYRPEPWTGEGLPPVGTLCDAEIYDGKGKLVWAESLIIHHHPHHSNSAAIAHGNGQLLAWASKFRPIRTPEQIAADNRLHEIRNALSAINSKVNFPNDLVRGNILAAAVEAMIDAGYRKQVAP